MASAGLGAPAASSRAGELAPQRDVQRSTDYATAAWLCAPLWAAVALAIGLVLGSPLGRLIQPDASGYTFLQFFAQFVHPEPTENARYLIAICVPLLFAAAAAAAPRWVGRLPGVVVVAGAIAAQIALAGVVIASIVAQRGYTFGAIYTRGMAPPFQARYFTPATLVVALLLAAAVTGALRAARLRQRAAAAMRNESTRRAVLIGCLAVAATVVWMLHAVHSDAEVANAPGGMRYHLGFTLDETFAVLNGRTPLVDFTAQYGSLWPFVVALPMLAFGKTLLTFTIVMCAFTSLALVAVYDVFRRVTGSATAALLLYLPFLATSLFQIGGTLQNRSSTGSYYANFPLRYAIPFFLACLTTRYVERGRRGAVGAWLLFVLAGLAVLNNTDFGIAALGATVAALLWTAVAPWRLTAVRVAAAVAAGLATALALVTLLTLVRAGSLPELWRLTDYARIYVAGGYSLMPIPGFFGVHLLVYLTYVAAIVVATVRAVRGASSRALTGSLAWAGVFGLGAGFYYVGRSHPLALDYQFSAWALALALLTIAAVGELSRARLRVAAIGAFVALFGFGVMACSLAQTPTPWGQLQRLDASFAPTQESPAPNPLVPASDPTTRRFVASVADGPGRFVYRHGAPVLILLTTGHRIADAYGVVNVSPYTGVESMETVQRVETALRALRDAGGNTVILPDPLDTSIYQVLSRKGFEPLTDQGVQPLSSGKRLTVIELPWSDGGGVTKWVDVRHLHVAAPSARH